MKHEFNPELKAVMANNSKPKAKATSENKYVALVIGLATIAAVILSMLGLIK